MGSADIQDRAADAARRGAVPLILKVAELFLMIVIGIYVAKICVLAMGIQSGEGGAVAPYVTLVIDVVMTIVTLDSLLSVTSRRTKAWKKVVRAALLLIVFNLIYWLGLSDSLSAYVVFNPLLVTPVAVLIILMMFTRSVREYYVPPMEEMKPLKDWVKYALVWPLYTSESYRIRYDGRHARSVHNAYQSDGTVSPMRPSGRSVL